jgi:hypothetical protein
MSLPATDNFDRDDVNPIGGNWTTIPSEYNHQIVSNVVKGASGGGNECGSYWNADTPNNDQYAQIRVTFNSGDYGAGPAVRISTSVNTFYVLWVNDRYTVILWKRLNGNWTNLGTYSVPFINSGDLLRLEVSGTTLTPIIAGTTYATKTDSDIASGMVGMMCNYNNGYTSLDDWEGGNLGAAGGLSIPVAMADYRQRRI